MTESIKVSEFPTLVGKELEPSAWIEITQERVNQFAEATNDFQFIHVDPEKAAQTAIVPENLVMGINYGSDKVRYRNRR